MLHGQKLRLYCADLQRIIFNSLGYGVKISEKCIKIFKAFGEFMRTIITAGLSIGIINFLCKARAISGVAQIEEGANV